MTRHEFLKPRGRVCLFSISSKPQPIKKKVKKKGLMACLKWKVHLAHPVTLRALHSNT